jgi:hypothetical protein
MKGQARYKALELRASLPEVERKTFAGLSEILKTHSAISRVPYTSDAVRSVIIRYLSERSPVLIGDMPSKGVVHLARGLLRSFRAVAWKYRGR